MRGGVQTLVIADSIVSGTNALLWQVPSTLQADTSYKIRIIGLNRSTVSDASDKSFSIGKTATAVAAPKTIISSYQLSQNYPNPFNPSTVINFQVPVSTHVSLKVYDILGKEVKTLVDARKEAGAYSVVLNANDLPGGIYFYRIQAGDFVQAKKLTLLK
jgi:hypothetical protein